MDGVSRLASTAIRVTAVVAVIAAMHFAQDVLIPIAFALLVALLLAPAVDLLERHGPGRVPSVLGVVALAILALGWTGWLVTSQVSDLAGRLPEYKDRIRVKAASIGQPLGGLLGRAYDLFQDIGKEQKRADETPPKEPVVDAVRVRIVETPPSPWEVISYLLTSALHTLGTAVLVAILVVFLLIYQADLRDRIVMLFGVNRIHITTQTISEAATSVSRYLVIQSAINALFGILIGIGLFALGVPNAVLWGFVAAVLRFIPYLGPWIGTAPPFLLSLAVFDGWGRPLALLGVVLVLEFLIANVLEPVLTGRRVGLSPLAVLVAAVFWTWLWGNGGLLLSVPLTVCVEVLGRHVSSLGFLSALLARETVVEPHVRFYHRLIGMNLVDAAEVLEEQRRRRSVLEVYDEVLIPALALAERDAQRGDLEKESYDSLLEGVEQALEDLETEPHPSARPGAAPEPASGATADRRRRLRLACVPADGRADELICRMAAHVLSGRDVDVERVPSAATTAEKVELVGRLQADAVLVSAIGPSGRLPAWHFYKRARRANPELFVLACAWGAGDRGEVARLRGDRNVEAVGGLRDAAKEIEQRAPEIVLRRNAVAPL
jgi:predicted PurR-regulated permease PerM